MTVLRFAKTPVNIKLERDVRPLLYELIYIDHVSSFERNDSLDSLKENKTQIKNFSLSDWLWKYIRLTSLMDDSASSSHRLAIYETDPSDIYIYIRS